MFIFLYFHKYLSYTAHSQCHKKNLPQPKLGCNFTTLVAWLIKPSKLLSSNLATLCGPSSSGTPFLKSCFWNANKEKNVSSVHLLKSCWCLSIVVKTVPGYANSHFSLFFCFKYWQQMVHNMVNISYTSKKKNK